MRNIAAREVAAVLLWSCLVMALTAVPYVIAERAAGPDRYFSGFLWGVDEGNVYLSWIRQASEGAWFIENQYTTRFQKPHFFNLFLLLLGRACHYFHLQPIQVFHLARLMGIPFALYAFYCLVAHITALRLVRGFALIFASLSSGFGWIATLLSYAGFRERVFPIDCGNGWQVMPEAVTFLSFLLNPLFTWSLGLMCLTLLWAWRAMEKPRLSTAALAGVLLLVLGNVHSYDVFTVHAAIVLWALFLLWRRKISLAAALKTYAVIWVIALPAPLWAWYASHADPAYLAKVNTPTLSPRLLDYAAGYGLLGVAALLGALTAWMIRKLYPRPWAVVGWAAATLALVYAPVSFQRKMIEGFHLALSYLAALALVLGLPWLVEKNWPRLMPANLRYARRRRLIFALTLTFVVLTVPSNVMFVYDTMQHVMVNNADLRPVLMPPVYLTGSGRCSGSASTAAGGTSFSAHRSWATTFPPGHRPKSSAATGPKRSTSRRSPQAWPASTHQAFCLRLVNSSWTTSALPTSSGVSTSANCRRPSSPQHKEPSAPPFPSPTLLAASASG